MPFGLDGVLAAVAPATTGKIAVIIDLLAMAILLSRGPQQWQFVSVVVKMAPTETKIIYER